MHKTPFYFKLKSLIEKGNKANKVFDKSDGTPWFYAIKNKSANK